MPQVPTSIAITLPTNKVAQGGALAATATVTSSKPITGTITFWEAGNTGPVSAALPITNGVVQAQLILPLIGVHQLTAQYSGDTLNQQSTSPSVIAVVTGQGSVSVTGTTGPVAHSVVVNVIIQ